MSEPVYLSPDLQVLTGNTLRPGGLTLTDQAMELCGFPRGSRLIDIGCGKGATVSHCSKKYSMDIWGVDLSFQMLSDAVLVSGNRERFIQAEGTALPISNNSMDGIFCECVMSLFKDPRCGLKEYYRILRPGGKLVIGDLYLRQSLAEGALKTFQGRSCLAGAMAKEEIINMVEESGFSIRIWEDKTYHLTQLAADMIFSHGSLDWFWNFMGNDPQTKTVTCKSKPGYFLLIAEKGNVTNG